MPSPSEFTPKGTAAVDLIRRTGAKDFQMRFQDDMAPTVWIAVASYGETRHDAAAALNPELAVFRLCEQLIDGGQCKHCERPSSFSADVEIGLLGAVTCCYSWDPELQTFRRGCEASDG